MTNDYDINDHHPLLLIYNFKTVKLENHYTIIFFVPGILLTIVWLIFIYDSHLVDLVI